MVLIFFGNAIVQAMEPKEKKPKKKSALTTRLLQSLSQNILNILASKELPQRQAALQNLQQDPFFFNELPKDLREKILGLLIAGATAETLELAAYTINALSLVDHQFNTLFNDPKFCLQIIKSLSQRFNCSNFTACFVLKMPQAKFQLKLQTDFFKMCQHRSPQLINFQTLCSKGLDIEFTYTHQLQELTPLMVAALFDNTRMFSYLIEAGADINHANKNGTTPLMIAMTVEHTELSSSFKDLPLIIELLLAQPKLAINQKNINGDTALMIGIRKGSDVSKLKLLLDAGADPEIQNNNGETALTIAQERGDPRIIEMIKDAIAKKHAKK